MKYFLVLGIEYKFFKKPANITIHVGDRLIDTFRLTRDYPCTTDTLPQIESKWFERHDRGYWLTRADWVKAWAEVPSLIKVYEVDDSALKGRLDIKVENANSDFTNGFMKSSSLMKFHITALFKKDLVRNRGEQMMKILIEFENRFFLYKKKKNPQYEYGSDGKWFTGKWPTAGSFWASRENQIHEKSEIKHRYFLMGGSFTAEFTIKTKHRTKYLAPSGDTKFIGFPYVDSMDLLLASYKPLLNIYDEDN